MKKWPHYDRDERDAVARVLASGRVNYWTGEEGRAFEREFADYCGVSHAVAVANGTVALELALQVLGIGRGDEVIVTPRTFLASASSIVLCGATPVFADVDRDSQNITPESAAEVLTPRTRAVMPVHLAGWPCDMDGFRELANAHELILIEDCAQAHGAEYRGTRVGSFGEAAAFSFCNDKIISTGGEGGMVLFREEDAWRRAWEFKDHGKSWDAVYNTDHKPGFRWLHETFGTNWRLTEMQSAIGRIQLSKLDSWLARRRRLAAMFNDILREVSAVRLTEPPAHIGHAYYVMYVFVRADALASGWTRDRIMNEVVAEGVPCGHGSCPEIYLEKAFAGTGLQPSGRLSVARELGATSLMLPVNPMLTDDEVLEMGQVFAAVLRRATR